MDAIADEAIYTARRGRNLSSFLSPDDLHPKSEPAPAPEEAKRIQTEDTAMVRWTVHQLNQQFPHVVLLFIPAMNYKDAGEVSSDPRNAAIEEALTQAAAAQGVPLLNTRTDFLTYYRTKGTNLIGFQQHRPWTRTPQPYRSCARCPKANRLS